MQIPTRRTTGGTASAAAVLVALFLAATPVWAAKPPDAGNQGTAATSGNQGAVKVVDADSGLESTTDNEPHVCTFYLQFSDAPNGETGGWTIVDWPPTGSGDEVASGSYVIPAGGSFETGTMELDAGHYRLNWQAINTNNEKHKTFWVDEGCETDEPEEQPEEPPQDEPEEQPEEQPEEEPQDDPEGDVEDSVVELPDPEDQPEEPPMEQPQEDPEQQPEDVTEAEEPTDPQDGQAPSIADEPVVEELPDTAMPMPAVLPGLGTAIGILLLVVAHRLVLDRGRRAHRS